MAVHLWALVRVTALAEAAMALASKAAPAVVAAAAGAASAAANAAANNGTATAVVKHADAFAPSLLNTVVFLLICSMQARATPSKH